MAHILAGADVDTGAKPRAEPEVSSLFSAGRSRAEPRRGRGYSAFVITLGGHVICRIAFEHALTAQWVLWTKGGEDLLAQQMSLQDHRRSSEFVDAVVRAAADTPDLAESAALAEELGEFIGEKPVSDWTVFKLCERFSSTRLLYGIYRDLSQAVHPTYGLVRAHFDITPPPDVVVGPINPFGAELDLPELIRGMAVSSLWALYVLEVSKAGHPDAAEVLRLGEEAGLPVDLRASDLQPHLQPDYEAVITPTIGQPRPTPD